MKKCLVFALAASLLLGALPLEAQGANISAESAVLVEPSTGTVLFEKNADERKLIASTTKIMTAMVVLERCRLDERVEVTPAHAAVEGSSMYLRPGEDYTVEDCLYGLLLASGNDAAAALADHCAGSMEKFAALMNVKAADLGLQNTHFENAHGLDGKAHYSSARDLAAITAEAMKNPEFCRMFGTKAKTVRGVTYYNHNKLLTTCEGCLGGKTGYTEAAGRVLVSCVEREGLRLVCVTVSDPNDWADHARLYDEAYAAWRYVPLPGEDWQWLETVSGMRDYVSLTAAVPGLVVPKAGTLRLRARLPRFVFAPVLAGTEAGGIDVYLDGEALGTVTVCYGETVPVNRMEALTAWERFRRLWFLCGGIYYLQSENSDVRTTAKIDLRRGAHVPA